jgi:hypothetical protein
MASQDALASPPGARSPSSPASQSLIGRSRFTSSDIVRGCVRDVGLAGATQMARTRTISLCDDNGRRIHRA